MDVTSCLKRASEAQVPPKLVPLPVPYFTQPVARVSPVTSRAKAGDVVPIPTLPLVRIIIFAVKV